MLFNNNSEILLAYSIQTEKHSSLIKYAVWGFEKKLIINNNKSNTKTNWLIVCSNIPESKLTYNALRL
jgi:hypothetical protein